MTNKYLKRYINKFIDSCERHDKDYYNKIAYKIKTVNLDYVAHDIFVIIKELSHFGQITKKNLYPLCQCILYGILNKSLTIFSMNSNALTKKIGVLREKPQYIQIKNINKKLKEIENIINIPINYISILPDYSKEFPFELYENDWNENKRYLEKISEKPSYRLSELYGDNFQKLKDAINHTIDTQKLEQVIKYYENNNFIILGFSANPNFQREQIINYLLTGVILEKILPFGILLDVQKKYYPFEQKFYNYARKYKLPIILCGQKF